MIFSSGYGANVGMLTALLNSNSRIIHDSYCHASFADGLKMAGVNPLQFSHNDVDSLNEEISKLRHESDADLFVGVEGVYSMEGDMSPLNMIVPLCKNNNAVLIVDDAHGTGIMGRNGRGTAEHFGVESEIDLTMGTFSKTFAATGAFITGSKPLINYLRFFARSYMFSASLSPLVVSTVLAGLDLLENDKSILNRFRMNVDYALKKINELGFNVKTQTGIIPIKVPLWMNIRKAAFEFHKRGIFLNSIEYPAVPASQQKFRISIMANHTKDDIDRLAKSIEEVWSLLQEKKQIKKTVEAA